MAPPVPRHDKGSFVMGYHCNGIVSGGLRSSCHTLFGFRGNKLTTFQTDSSEFALASGPRPGMTLRQAKAREPDGGWDSVCARVFLPSGKGTVRALSIARWSPPRVFSVYVSTGNAAFDTTC